MHNQHPAVLIEDLGAASDRTRGVWDPIHQENFMLPESWEE